MEIIFKSDYAADGKNKHERTKNWKLNLIKIGTELILLIYFHYGEELWNRADGTLNLNSEKSRLDFCLTPLEDTTSEWSTSTLWAFKVEKIIL